jgi:hypothetical protein
MICKLLSITLVTIALGGCWNGENVHVTLGDVSLGQQLLDLKSALDQKAITETEYAETKETLLALNSLCENTESEISWF